MSDDTYYSVLEITENATQAEIKTAYRNLIKQVHPDTLSKLSPYLRGLAEARAKEMTEAYSVLSNVAKRRQYDQLIAAHRQQSAPAPPPQPSAPQSPTSAPPQPTQSSKLRFNAEPLRRWARTHPVIVCGIGLYVVIYAFSFFSGSPSKGPVQDGQYSQYPCEPTQTYSPIDRRPCKPSTSSKTAAPIAKTPIALNSVANPLSPGSGHTIAGTYFGSVHNKTANLTASFGVLFQQKDSAAFDGCMDVKPPLYGSGLLSGAARGSHIEFAVSNIRFQGEAQGSEVSGSYIVSKGGGAQEQGDFHLTKRMSADAEYRCANGTLTEIKTGTTPLAFNPRLLPPNWERVCPADAKNCKPSALHVWIAGDSLYETSENTIGNIAGATSCTTKRVGTEWRGSCQYTLTWKQPPGTVCKVETSERITGVSLSRIAGVSQRVDYTPLRALPSRCPVAGSENADFEYIPAGKQRAEKPHPKPVAFYAIVTGNYYGSLKKRCAFLPLTNYGRCHYQPETIAELRGGDRVRILSPQLRAENGDDIYKIRTQQGWEGWIDSRGITIETQ
jgi:hypothetical protein